MNGTAVAAGAAGAGTVHLSPRDTLRDRASGAGGAVETTDAGDGVAAGVTKDVDVPFDVDVAKVAHRGHDDSDVDFATVNPLRLGAKLGCRTRGQDEGSVSLSVAGAIRVGVSGSVVSSSSATVGSSAWRQLGSTALSDPTPSRPETLTAAVSESGLSSTDRGRRVLRARLPVPGHE